MLDPVINTLLALSISINYFTFTQDAELKLKGRALAPVLTFVVIQLFLFMIGWGLAQLLSDMLTGNESTIYPALLAVVGLKRMARYFTTKKEARSFTINHMFYLVGLSVAVATDSLIFGLGFGLAGHAPGQMLLLLVLTTLLAGLAGIFFKQRTSKAYGSIGELISGVLILVLAIVIFFDGSLI